MFEGQADTARTASFDSATAAFTASFNLATAEAQRRMLSVFNDSTVALYLKCGPSASSGDFTVKISSGQLYELPRPVWNGLVTAVFSATGTGRAQVTELR